MKDIALKELQLITSRQAENRAKRIKIGLR